MTVAGTTHRRISPRQTRGAIAALTGGLFLAALDQSLFATTLPTVAGDVGAGAHLYWISTATVLAGAVVMPVLGRLGDDLGRRRVFVAALGVLVCGSALGGLSQNLPTLLGARVLQGIGGGGLLVLVEAMVADLVPARRRTWTLSLVGAAFALASVVGPVLGGLLTQTVGWRWAFWLNLPLGAVAIVAARALLPSQRESGAATAVPLIRSLIPLAATVIGITLLTSWTADPGRPSTVVLIVVVVGTVSTAWLWLRNDLRAKRPPVALSLSGVREYALAVTGGFLVAVTLFGVVAFLPTYLQMGVGLSPGRAGLTMLGTVAGLGTATVVSAQIVGRTGRYRALPPVGAGIGALALLLLFVAVPQGQLALVTVGLVLVGVGIGCAWEVLVVVAQSVAPAHMTGVATAGNGFVREVGVLLGTTGVGAWYGASVQSDLSGQPLAGIGGWMALTPQRLTELPAESAQAVRDAYTQAFTPILVCLAPVVAVAAVLLLFLRPRSLADGTRRGAGR